MYSIRVILDPKVNSVGFTRDTRCSQKEHYDMGIYRFERVIKILQYIYTVSPNGVNPSGQICPLQKVVCNLAKPKIYRLTEKVQEG